MGHFDQKGGKPQSDTQSDFVCCDLCCKDENLKVPISAPAPYAGKTRTVSTSQKATLKGKLIRLRKSLLVELLHQSPKGGLPVASVPELLIGFSDSQVLENCDILYDDSTFVEERQDFESSDMHVPELGDLIDKVQIE